MAVNASEPSNSVIHESHGKELEEEITLGPVWLDHEVPDWWGI